MTVSSQADAPTRAAPSAHRVTRSTWARWAPLSGVAFVVLVVAGFSTMNTPDADASNKKWIDFFASSGNQISMVVSGFLLVLAGLCLLWFLTTVWSRIAAARRPEPLSPLALGAAGVSAAAIAVGGVMNAVIPGGMLFAKGKLPEPSAEFLRVFSQISFPLIAVAGMIAAALAIGVLSTQARQAGVFGKGLTIFSLVVAVVALFSFIFFPMLLVLVWFLVASVALLRRRAPVAGAAAEATMQNDVNPQ
jgi:hypothetical protein